MFAYGLLSVVLVLYLAELGFSDPVIGVLLSLTLIGDAVISLIMATTADRFGRRRLLILGAGELAQAAHDDGTFGLKVANVNLKAGQLNNVDLQLIVENYVYEQVRADGTTARKSGFGDLTTRLKVNLWANDRGATAFGVMPFVKFPTNTGGLGNPFVGLSMRF